MAARTLYVSRPLLNADALRRWAADHGFHQALPASDMHVTIAYSQRPLEAPHPELNRLHCEAGDGCQVKQLGAAAVLRFHSPILAARWRAILDMGASWDFPEYQPHVTISYSAPPGLDLAAILPYRGPLIFGPERHKEVNLSYRDSVAETPLPAPRMPILFTRDRVVTAF